MRARARVAPRRAIYFRVTLTFFGRWPHIQPSTHARPPPSARCKERMPAERTCTNRSVTRRAPRSAARTPPFQFHVCHSAANEVQQQFNHGGCMLFSAPCTIPARCTLAFLASMTLESLAEGCASIAAHPAGHPIALRLDLHLAHFVHQLFAACCTVLRSSTSSLPTSFREHLLTRLLRRRYA